MIFKVLNFIKQKFLIKVVSFFTQKSDWGFSESKESVIQLQNKLNRTPS